MDSACRSAVVPQDNERVSRADARIAHAPAIVDALKRGHVVLVHGLAEQQAADEMIGAVASGFGLLARLKLQAEFASMQGHRQSVGQYCMTVNQRDDYQFIPPHSEGTANAGIQLGGLYCRQNTTDGGANLLFHTNSDASAWSRLREACTVADLGGMTLGRREQALLRAKHGIMLPRDVFLPGSEVIREQNSSVPGARIFDILRSVDAVHSTILGSDVRVLWDNVATPDFDLAADFMRMLQTHSLLRSPGSGADLARLDVDYSSHTTRSGLKLADIFDVCVIHRLAAGEMLLFDNCSWAHSTSNWTPGSGRRDVVATFA